MPVSGAALMARATNLGFSSAHILLKFYLNANRQARDNCARHAETTDCPTVAARQHLAITDRPASDVLAIGACQDIPETEYYQAE